MREDHPFPFLGHQGFQAPLLRHHMIPQSKYYPGRMLQPWHEESEPGESHAAGWYDLSQRAAIEMAHQMVY